MHWLDLLVTKLTSVCKLRQPDIGRELPSDFREARKVFDARVKAIYPEGMSEERLVDELRRQGFILSPKHDDTGYAVFTRKSVVIHISWSVSWRAENGKIVSIAGTYGSVAL